MLTVAAQRAAAAAAVGIEPEHLADFDTTERRVQEAQAAGAVRNIRLQFRTHAAAHHEVAAARRQAVEHEALLDAIGAHLEPFGELRSHERRDEFAVAQRGRADRERLAARAVGDLQAERQVAWCLASEQRRELEFAGAERRLVVVADRGQRAVDDIERTAVAERGGLGEGGEAAEQQRQQAEEGAHGRQEPRPAAALRDRCRNARRVSGWSAPCSLGRGR